MNLELIPLLVLVLLMLAAGGVEVQSAELLLEGDHEVTDPRGALIVADAEATVPADVEVAGPIFVIGGTLTVEGRVAGDVTQLGGTLVVATDAAIDGELLYVAGTESIAPGAAIGERTTIDPTPAEPGPLEAYVPWLVTTGFLALVGGLIARRWPRQPTRVGVAIRDHPLVSLTVGTLLFVTALAVFVFMAFTLILVPLSILGLGLLAASIGYGVVALGHHVGRRITVDRPGLATAAGVVAVMVALEVIRIVPVLGDLVSFAVLLAGLGGVLVTYYGFATFEPVALPE